jgi:outer membrane protein OmpA-like peptidoglycan-associated protein
MHLPVLLIWAALAFLLLGDAAKADNRVALVIGNSDYSKVGRLLNPTNDANDIGASLSRLGFKLTRVLNGNYDAMRRAIGEFTRQANGADQAVIFYSGHGMEVAGENWLVPVDAELQSDNAADTEAINLKTLLIAVKDTKSLGLIILDACRNNPFAARMQRTNRSRDVERGLKRIEPEGTVLVVYAAKDGTTAADGSGRNSPFTRALLQHVETPGLEIVQLFRNVRDDVLTATSNQQQAFVYGSPSRNLIYLKPPEGKDAVPVEDEVNWRIIKQAVAAAEFNESIAPQAKLALEAKAIQQFLTDYPKSRHAAEASTRLRELSTQLKMAPTVSVTTEEEALWRSLIGVRSGQLAPDLAIGDRLETERVSLIEYKRKFPQTARAAEIDARLKELDVLIAKNPTSRSDEEKSWAALEGFWHGDTRQDLSEANRLLVGTFLLGEFMRRFPASAHMADAKSRYDQMQSRINSKLNTPSPPGGDGATAAGYRAFVTALRAKSAKSLTAQQRERLADIARQRPNLELEITFEYGSATLGKQALPVLRSLGSVLGQDQYKEAIFLVGGHTDGSGSVDFNLDLSERRAEAVKRFLIEEYKLPSANYVAAGFGKAYLKNTVNPLADENRRVVVTNMDAK